MSQVIWDSWLSGGVITSLREKGVHLYVPPGERIPEPFDPEEDWYETQRRVEANLRGYGRVSLRCVHNRK